MLACLIPPPLVVAEVFGDVDDAPLEEAAGVARAVDKRRPEFATGRAYARRAPHRLAPWPDPAGC